jgi:pimeloyl-ACP methyl ester carboxylesterase
MDKLALKDKNFLVYKRIIRDVDKPMVVYLHGFSADMESEHTGAIDKLCEKKKMSFLKFDYIGHGKSSGKFEDGTITSWLENVMEVLDKLTKGKLILVGHSMGGWLMLLATLKEKSRVLGLLGIAPAPDFTNCLPELIENVLGIPARKDLKEKGFFEIKRDDGEGYLKITEKLIKDGNKNLVLHRRKIRISCPIRIVHGMRDVKIPFKRSLKIAKKVSSNNVQTTFIKDGEHALERPIDIKTIIANLEDLL